MANVIYKDNNLIEASYALTLSEQRLILIAIIAARDMEKELTADTLITIHASEYMQHFNLGRQSAYEALQSACDNLFERRLTYKAIDPVTGKQAIYKSRWVSKVGYVKEAANVQLIFTPDILPLFIKLEEKFTKYELKQISQLTSVYAIRLYELLIRWRSTGKLYIAISELRDKLGLSDDEYDKMGDFKKRVLNVAVDQINKFTDIAVSYTQKKEGRTITDINFVFEEKKLSQKTQGTTFEPIYKLSAKQCLYFSQKLCDSITYPKFGMKYANVGETSDKFQERIALELMDPENVQKYYMYLKEVGYKEKYKSVT
ncbi:replication initiation protein RepM [Acinetobacter baumannii]|uniref:replication initiation protein RepM n=1 Tax=Acinetobacter baumannii TaxID=470 RepID=UPI00244B9386|nr:replication initiation protein RepM [Acinetobacter baumannii]MDH2528288.1 replication initiation protein RepM [Acinetobacter baumannii]